MRALQGGLLVAAVAALAGCTAGIPEASAPPTDSPGPGRPVIVFGGDCHALLSDAEVGAAIGAELVLTARFRDLAEVAVDQLGGLSCAWEDATSSPVRVTVLPADAIPPELVTDDAPFCEGGTVAAGEQESCSFATVAGDFWFTGVVDRGGGPGPSADDVIATLVEAVTPRLESEPPPPPYRPERYWGLDLDCSVFDVIDVGPVLGETVPVAAGNAAGEVDPGTRAAMTAAGYLTCLWHSGSGTAEVSLLPGAAWAVQGGIVDPRAPIRYVSQGSEVLGISITGPDPAQASLDLAELLLVALDATREG